MRSLLPAALGLWLIAVALTFSSASPEMFVSDLMCGCVLIVLGILSLDPHRVWSRWAVGIVGVWLQFAPLVFWAPSVLLYVNDTLVGVILIALAFLLTKKPNGIHEAGVNPTGWSYNPSSWSHRIPTVALAMLCWFFSRYMAAYQLGYIDQIWDPVFHNGTLNVITSKLSKKLPISDAGLGALCYTLESVLGWQGGERRFRTMPWLVLGFGFLVVPVGAVSITLIILQPIIVGSWCAWCLATAASMLLMIVLTAGELMAVLQFLYESLKSGKPFWKVFWKGEGASESVSHAKGSSGWGVTLPWNLVLTLFLGVWLMVSPSFFHEAKGLSVTDYIEGPIMIALSVIAMAEVFRSFRFANILLGLWLIILPFIRPESSPIADWNNVLVGVLAILLSLRKGKVSERYGMWDRFIR